MEQVTVNKEQGLYVIPSGRGYSCLGFGYAEKRRAAVYEWLGKPDAAAHAPGTIEHYGEYLTAMRVGAEASQATGKRCPAELTPALIGLEGKRVEVTERDGSKRRFYVGKSTGWMPCHLEIARRDSTGGFAVYLPEGATVRVIPGKRR